MSRAGFCFYTHKNQLYMSLDFPNNKSHKGKLLAMDKNINCEYLLRKPWTYLKSTVHINSIALEILSYHLLDIMGLDILGLDILGISHGFVWAS